MSAYRAHRETAMELNKDEVAAKQLDTAIELMGNAQSTA
jgi:hypothetical protein